jgi:hypothetical protein
VYSHLWEEGWKWESLNPAKRASLANVVKLETSRWLELVYLQLFTSPLSSMCVLTFNVQMFNSSRDWEGVDGGPILVI